MPILMQDTIFKDCVFGVWEITESFEELVQQVEFYPEEQERFDGFKSTDRKMEWLSVRVLVKKLLGSQPQIVYNDKRKPFLLGEDKKVSISHSKNLTAIMLSDNKKIGMDLEYMSHSIEHVAHKFINDDEYINSTDEDLKHYHLYIHWCAKEALYKICDKQDINFKKNLTLDPFEPSDCGRIYGWVDNKFWHDKFEMNYFRIKDYVVVMVSK